MYESCSDCECGTRGAAPPASAMPSLSVKLYPEGGGGCECASGPVIDAGWDKVRNLPAKCGHHFGQQASNPQPSGGTSYMGTPEFVNHGSAWCLVDEKSNCTTHSVTSAYQASGGPTKFAFCTTKQNSAAGAGAGCTNGGKGGCNCGFERLPAFVRGLETSNWRYDQNGVLCIPTKETFADWKDEEDAAFSVAYILAFIVTLATVGIAGGIFFFCSPDGFKCTAVALPLGILAVRSLDTVTNWAFVWLL